MLVLSEVDDRFTEGARVLSEVGGELVVEGVRSHGARLLVKFRGLDDRTAVEGLHGRYLFVAEEDLPPAPEGAWWPHQLEGCEVVTEGGTSLGSIREVVLGVANDIWVAGDAEEVLIPALRDVVVSVDVDERRVVVREVPGLTVPE